MSRRTRPDLASRATSLEAALDSGGHRLEPGPARSARAALGKIGERQRLSGDHTVVALAGATGSGKSSLFNALTGLEISQVGARRPTTSTATACVWGAAGAEDLLEWLGVPRRHRIEHGSELDPHGDEQLRGLVLLDLPDHDSTEMAHRLEVDRLVELVDVFVWVTDPQKYADAALHRRYLSRLAGHDAVTLVVLNQADRLEPAAREACRRDLQRLVEADGLRGVEVLTTSVRTGEGVPQLRGRLAAAVGRRSAWSERLSADLDAAVVGLRPSVAEAEADPGRVAEGSGLVEALAGAAGVPAVVRAVEADYVRGAMAAGGWPVTRWARRLRPDPLRRLRLGTGASPDAGATARSSLPAATSTQRSRVELATRRVADRAGAGLPPGWEDAARAAAVPPGDDLGDALDQAVVSTDLTHRRPIWWSVVRALQALLVLAAAVGIGWLLALAATGWLQLPQPRTPYVGVLPVPTALALGGLLVGALLGVLVRLLARRGSRRRGRRVRSRLHAAVEQVARSRVLAPVERVLTEHRETREHLAAAGVLRR